MNKMPEIAKWLGIEYEPKELDFEECVDAPGWVRQNEGDIWIRDVELQYLGNVSGSYRRCIIDAEYQKRRTNK